MTFQLTGIWRTAVAASAALLAAVGGLVLVGASPASAAVAGHILFPVAGTTSWTVPAGVTTAVFRLDGGSGGSETTYQGKTTDGGKGGQVSGVLTVTPGQTYTIGIGGQGGSVQGFYNSVVGGGAGGAGGGGDGGSGDDPGAGGGGASQVSLDNTLLFAAAGGGGGTGSAAFDQQSPGGDGGGLTGADGSVFNAEAQYGAARGGTQSQGGAAGTNDHATGESAGTFELGGHGGSASSTDTLTTGGAGGGGGLYGGGGGGSSGGGGGSSYLTPDALNTSNTAGDNTDGGYVNIDYGVADTPGMVNPTPMRATAGQPFSYQLTTTSWPTPQIVAVGGSLPTWLTLSSNGLLSGTTTKAGEYDFRLAALGPYGETTYAMSVFVNPGATGHMTIDGITPSTTAGTRFPGTATGHWVDDYGNGISGVSFVALLLTDGPTATFDNGATSVQSVTGPDGRFSIGGVTAGPTPGTLDLAVAYAPFQYSRVHLTITPANAQATFGVGDPPTATVGTPYSYVVRTSGSPTPTVSLNAGTLPPGLAIAPDGTLSGTPSAAGTYTVSLLANNGFGNPATRTLVVHVAPAPAPAGAPTIGSATGGDGTAIVRFTPPVNDGGAPITSYTVTASPGGRTATGTVSPITVTGLTNGTKYTFTVTAKNSVGIGPASARSNAVTPAKALAIATASPLPAGTVGAKYARTLVATGGIAPYSWALTSGSSLPAGLTLHSNGTVTGTPTKAATSSFTVHVTDAASPAHTATKGLSVTIRPAPPRADLAVSIARPGAFVAGHNGGYRFTVTNTGTAATAGTTTVSVAFPGGLTPTWTKGSVWTCNGHGQSGSCTQTAPIGVKHTSVLSLQVHIAARAGQLLTTTAVVAPTDSTPGDNTATDHVRIQ
jgi:hypothetical protein